MTMLRFCDKWWMTAGRGAIAAVFGLAVLFLPGLDHRTLAVALGVFAFVDGLMLAALAVVARHSSRPVVARARRELRELRGGRGGARCG